MVEKYADCQLKGLILRSILNSKNTPKSIFEDIQYKGNLDNLHKELYSLRRRGYLTQHKIKRVSIYDLTTKGRKHALNPLLSLEIKRQRASNEVISILKNEKKFMDAVKRYVDQNYSRPIIENCPPSINQVVRGDVDTSPGKTGYVSISSEYPKNDEGTIPDRIPSQNDYFSRDEWMKALNAFYAKEKVERDRFRAKQAGWAKSESIPQKKPVVDCDNCSTIKKLQKKIADQSVYYSINLAAANSDKCAAIKQTARKVALADKRKVAHVPMAEARKKLAKKYYDNHWYLDRAFFEGWGNVFPKWTRRLPKDAYTGLGYFIFNLTKDGLWYKSVKDGHKKTMKY
ncbi:MAG: hypothetical protein WA130_07070 [Candidatus Methanoperedens sp.]